MTLLLSADHVVATSRSLGWRRR